MQTFRFIPAPDQQKFYSVFMNRNGDYIGTYDAQDKSFNTSGERQNLRLEELKELIEKFEELSKDDNASFKGQIVKHDAAPHLYGGVAVQSIYGKLAIIKEHQEEAAKNMGEFVLVSKVDDSYQTVKIEKIFIR